LVLDACSRDQLSREFALEAPSGIHIGLGAPHKASPATAFRIPSPGLLSEFELAYYDLPIEDKQIDTICLNLHKE
jgi:hypothetical protein